ncbi:uncharacterized protein EI97DRAFT_379811 [Westerdykella ornata]|uniref:F-box domain-containing protein n=1 Tax=Westerdykella ornata TaxID=318751 RepID=A0A6A6JGM0_WESOR|nr:uncharacterized protein EI97DRAFT_379811 [Westerdykella ornata]KAF2275253.1 hypothetical protein EI97DRAFT_379811 [Westerdykella ornata]
MGLLQLPGEVLDEIIDFAVPDGLENFALSCKLIYARASSQIFHHNRRTRIGRYAAQPSNDRGKPLLLLFEISRDPSVADYIDVLNLRNPNPDDNASGSTQLTDEFRMEEEAMDGIKNMVTQSAWLESAGVNVEDWWDAMMDEDETVDDEDDFEGVPCTVVSLLSQLPNLRSLQLPETWVQFRPESALTDRERQLLYVLDALVAYSNAGAKGVGRPLQHLETLLPFSPSGYEARAALQSVEPFLALKGLRELFGVALIAVDDSYTGIPFRWRSDHAISSLRRIELAHCCIDADGISEFLSRTPQLEIFRYSHETKWHGCEHDWNAGAFIGAIARHCGATITEMAITIDEMYGDIINGASSFLAFNNLRTLEVDVQIFCGPPLESGQRRGLAAMVPDGETPWTEHDIPCIASMLPPSIEHMVINTDFPQSEAQALRSLLKNIPQQQAERLPQLQTVIIRQFNDTSGEEVFGIPGHVHVVDGNAELKLQRSMLPLWKRNFSTRVGGIAYT